MKKKSIKMLGRNEQTPPTPAMMPSTNRSLTMPSGNTRVVTSPSHPKNDSNHAWGYAPNVKVIWNMNHRKKIRIGNPNHRLVNILSTE